MDNSASTITLTSYEPNHLIYEAKVQGSKQLAVFSEIYYEGTDNDWKVFIDGQTALHFRVNYILRAMEIPVGEHLVEFRFVPISYFKGENISLASSIVVLLLVLGAFGFEIRNSLKSEKSDSTES